MDDQLVSVSQSAEYYSLEDAHSHTSQRHFWNVMGERSCLSWGRTVALHLIVGQMELAAGNPVDHREKIGFVAWEEVHVWAFPAAAAAYNRYLEDDAQT